MNCRIEKKEGFTVVGVKEWLSTQNGENLKKIPMMWENLSKENYTELLQLSNCEPSGVFGVCADMYNDGFDYWIAAATTKEFPDGMEKLEIPASTWAIFEAIGPLPNAIQEVWNQIFSEWSPNSEYEHANVPEIEWYSAGDSTSPTYKSEVWIPIVKK